MCVGMQKKKSIILEGMFLKKSQLMLWNFCFVTLNEKKLLEQKISLTF